MKKFIRLREDLHKRVKQEALNQDVSAEAVLEAIVTIFFEKADATSPKIKTA